MKFDLSHEVTKLKDEYFDVPLNELSFVINGIKETEDTEGLRVSKATMYIDAEWHGQNCVGVYDITDIVRRHKSLALYKLARNNTINHPRVDVGIIVEWEV